MLSLGLKFIYSIAYTSERSNTMQAHVQYSKEVFSIISVDKKLVPILLEEMKWPPAGNFKSHSKYLLKFEEAVFLIFNEDTMDFKKLVNYISEFVLQVRVLPYIQ